MQNSAILNTNEISIRVRRMAFEIWEQNFSSQQIFLAGIEKEGYQLAEMLASQLRELSPLLVNVIAITLDKTAKSQSDVKIAHDIAAMEGQSVIIVDDVLNTGKTIAFALQPFLAIPLLRLQVAVLIDRSHRSYPIRADYVGYALSTTLSSHVETILEPEADRAAYLHD
jgi:pyrimidine operon attenuation protein / uracil phosphoribosyltransferase